MGKVLAVALWVLVILTVWMFVGQNQWWFPETISDYGPRIDAQFMRTLVIVAIGFIGAQVALGYAVWRFGRRGNERAVYTHGNNKLEMTWTVITAIVFIGTAILGQMVWADLHIKETPPGAEKIHVVAQQFNWNFHYAGADKTFGRTDPTLINDDGLNFVGLDTSDPNAKDDAQVTTLVIPVNRPVELMLRSKDVIHDLFVPALRIKQDAVPGLNVRFHFTATKIGKFELTCAELCGSLHYNMKSLMLVLPQADYDALTALPEEPFKARLSELLGQYELNKAS
ncbi:MAG TPA: cytochrome c oxidase subunit II [Blastocatellia bacterium]|nr:cytochrome c oxidase subunit II [Blastocatellia bacterium]